MIEVIPPLSIGRGNSWKRKEHIGECTLYLGDSLEIMPDVGMIDHCITDPPFEAEAHTLQRRVKRGGVCENESLPFASIENREKSAVEIVKITTGWAMAFCQAESVQVWRESFEAAGASYRRSMIWVKPDGMPQYSGDRPGFAPAVDV